MRGSRNFCRGGGGGGGGVGGPRQSDKKSSDSVVCLFFAFFLVLGLFYSSHMINFKEKYHFSRFRRGSKFFQGVGGIRNTIAYSRYCLFPIETQITCDFQGGSGPPAPSPLAPHLAAIYLVSHSANDAIASCTCGCARSPATSLFVFSRFPQ